MNENFLKIKGKDIKNNLVSLSQLVIEVTDVCNLRCKYCGYLLLNTQKRRKNLKNWLIA